MNLYPDDHTILRFRLHLLALTMLHQLFTSVQLHGTQLTALALPFPIRSIPQLLTIAPMSVLQSTPTHRLRKTYFHLMKSIISRLLIFLQVSSSIQDTLCDKLLLSILDRLLFIEFGLRHHSHCIIGGFFLPSLSLLPAPFSPAQLGGQRFQLIDIQELQVVGSPKV